MTLDMDTTPSPAPHPSLAPVAFSSEANLTSHPPASRQSLPYCSKDLPPLSDLAAVRDYFDVAATRAFIDKHQAKHVALQLPDHLLHYAATLSAMLSSPPGCVCYVLADTTFSPCCVDTIAAQHVQADVLIHYGVACLSAVNTTTPPLPVHYVFGKANINTTHLAQQLQQNNFHKEQTAAAEDEKKETLDQQHQPSSLPDSVIVVYDLEYEHAMLELRDMLKANPNIIFSEVDTRSTTAQAPCTPSSTPSGDRRLCGHLWRKPSSSCCYIFIGSDSSPLLLSLLLTDNTHTVYLYSPSLSSPTPSIFPAPSSSTIQRLLSRRFYLMNCARSAHIFGLLLGTLSLQNTLSTLTHLQSLIRNVHKTCYTFVVGKINEVKLANFTEIDVFVLLACPFSVLLLDMSNRQMYRPVISVYECEIALTGKTWTGEYQLDMNWKEQPEAEQHIETETQTPADDKEAQADEPVFDPVSGKLIAALPTSATNVPSHSTALQPISNALSTITPRTAADVMATRSWKGLETREQRIAAGQHVAAVDTQIEIGLSGIASGYSKEIKQASSNR